MTLPAALVGILLATACGLAFHVVRGGGVSRIALDVVAAWVSFFLGHAVGEWLHWELGRVGPLNLFPAFLATLLGLIAASALVGPEKTSSRRGGPQRPSDPRS
jgi:hypothetical protein